MTELFKSLPNDVQGELHTRGESSTEVKFANSEFEGTSDSRHEARTLRVLKNGKMSTAKSSKPGSEDELLRAALESVPYGTEVKYDFPGSAELRDMKLADEEVSTIETQEMIDIADDLAQTLIGHDSRINVMAGVNRRVLDVRLVNSNGFDGSYRKTVWTTGLGGRLIQGDDFLWFGEFRSAFSPSQMDYDDLKREVIQQYEWAKNTVPFEAGAYPVIFAPSQVSFLMRPFLASLNGKAFSRGISPWIEALDQKLLDERLTIVDDGTLDESVTSAPFDREGTPTRRNVLIGAGVPKNLVLDLQTAAELERESTGNGSLQGPGPHRVLVAPGAKSLNEMVQDIDKGLIIFGTMGAWTGNPYSGNVSGTVSLGLMIENGEIAGRVKNCMFSINSFEHFRNSLIELSSERKDILGGGPGVGGATYPYVALDDVVIATE